MNKILFIFVLLTTCLISNSYSKNNDLIPSSTQINVTNSQENKPLTIDQINQLNVEQNQNEKNQSQLNRMIIETQMAADNRFSDCLKATGANLFCDCINNKLPAVLTYLDYVKIITANKDDTDKMLSQSCTYGKHV